MILLNFSHPLTAEQSAAVARLSGQQVDRVIDVATHFDHARPFVDQAAELVDRVGLAATDWSRVPVVVNLPSFAPVVAAMLAEIHGRTGHFPSVLRLRPVAGSTPSRYEVAELIDLQAARDAARGRRF
jgi:hypothetical protein